MNTSIALRLVWKEYRIQRGLWLAMAIGCLMFQRVVAYLVLDPHEAAKAMLAIAFSLTFFYAIGSGAITFAIEREEGTQIRPVMAGCPPGLTLAVKTVFGIVTTALLLTLAIGSGMMLTLGSLIPSTAAYPFENTILLGLLYVVMPYLGTLLWSMFFSLVTRKVIVALGLATIAIIMTGIGYLSVLTKFSGSARGLHASAPFETLIIAALIAGFLTLVLLVMNYLLADRWLTRGFFDQAAVRSPSLFRNLRFRRSDLGDGVVVEIGGEERTAVHAISPDVAMHQPAPGLSLRRLYEN